MSAKNKAVLRRYAEEIWNKGKSAVIDELIATNFMGHFPGFPETAGREGFRQLFTLIRTAFPDGRFTIEDMVAEGDKVVVRWTFRGTHKGDYGGIAPTGQEVTWTAISISRVAGGKIEEMWGVADNLNMMQLLGLVS